MSGLELGQGWAEGITPMTSDLDQITTSPGNRYDNGSYYEGGCHHGKRLGFGVGRYPGGEIWRGMWSYGFFEGYGEYTYANGDTYRGQVQG